MQVAVCVLDALEEANARPGFRARLSQSRHQQPRQRTSSSGVATHAQEGSDTEPKETDLAANSSGSVSTTSTTTVPWNSHCSASQSSLPPAPKGPPLALNPFPPPLPAVDPVPANRLRSYQSSSTQCVQPPAGQHFSPWSVWNEAEEQQHSADPNLCVHTGSLGSSAPFPAVHGAGFWNPWEEAEEQHWGGTYDPDSAQSPPPWDTSPAGNTWASQLPAADTYEDIGPGFRSAAAAIHSASSNPALPPGWPTDQSFADHCNILHTLDPRVCPNSFTLFDVALQVRLIPKPRSASQAAMRDLARAHCRHLTPPVHIHMLTDEVPGFPSPQFTASAGELPRRAFAVPIDLRPCGWGVCVAPAKIGASVFTLAYDAAGVCPVRNFEQKIARQTLLASSKGRDLDRFAPVPIDTDHVRVRRGGSIYPSHAPQQSQDPHAIQAQRDDDEAILGHIEADGTFQVAVHAPDCPTITVTMHYHDSPHSLVRQASRRLLSLRPHSTVQACWPVEQPRDGEHLLHLLLDFDTARSPDSTMYLVDTRGVESYVGNFAVFMAPREMTAGELFSMLQSKVPCRHAPAQVLINNSPLRELGVRRYSSPLIRLLSREQFQAWDAQLVNFCPATFSTQRVLQHLPCFLALSETYDAFLQRTFGVFRRRSSVDSATQADDTTTTTTAVQTGFQSPATRVSFSVFPTWRHPYDPLELAAVQIHLSSGSGDVLTSNVQRDGLIEVLLYKFCRSLHAHCRLPPAVEIVTHPRIHFSAQGVHLFLCVTSTGMAARCWVYAPQWHEQPLLLRCANGYSRAGLFQAAGIPDCPRHVVTIEGQVYERSVHPQHGDVIIIATSALKVHTAPLMALLPRMPDIQALFFRHQGPGAETLKDAHALRIFWRSAVHRCQHRFGLDGPGVRATLIGHLMPIMVVCVGTLVFPTPAQVQEFYNVNLASKFGQRFFTDTAHVDRENALLYQRMPEGSIPWLIRLPTGFDVLVADKRGTEFQGRHVEGEWYLQPATASRFFGIACITKQSGGASSSQQEQASPSDESDHIDFEVSMSGVGSPPDAAFLADFAADIRRAKDDGLLVVPPDTPPAAFGGRPPPPLTGAHVQAARDAAFRYRVPDFSEAFPVFERLLSSVPEPSPSATDPTPEPLGHEEAASTPMSVSPSETGALSVDSSSTSSNPVEVDPTDEGRADATSMLQITAVKVRSASHQGACVAVGETTPHVTSIRAIATPCRAKRIPAKDASLSGARDEPVTAAHAPATDTGTVIISLHQVIPPTMTEAKLPLAQLHTGAVLETFLGIAELFDLQTYQLAFQLPERHAATTQALATVPRWPGDRVPEELHLYTDGSFFDATGAGGWAVVALVHCRQEWFWAGYISGQLYPEGHPHHAGQTVINPHTAELLALVHAMATVVQHPGVKCTVHYDATSAAAIADGHAASKAQPRLMYALLAFRYAAAHLCSEVSFEHVAAHDGHPWNEAADTAAKAAAKYGHFHCLGSARLAKAVRNGELDWLWLTITPQCHEGVLPGLDDEGSTLPHDGLCPCQHALDHIPGIPEAVVAACTPHKGRAKWHLKIATYNCTTLTKECDRQCLATCFARDGLHIVGMQESRTAPGVKRSQGPYTCFCSPADKGNLGCQLWVKHGEALAYLEDGSAVLFDVSKAAIQIREPRLLIVILPAGAQLFACIVAHAPVADTHPVEAAAWWRHLDVSCRRVPRNATPLIFIDGNARFYSTDAGHSARDGTPKGANGQALQAFVHEHGLETARSRDSNNQPIVTWWSPQGFPAHIDYVAFPIELASCATTDGVPAHFVDPVGFDHKPLQVTLQWEAAAASSTPRRLWDRDKMRTKEGQLLLARIFNQAPAIQWDVHPDDHIQQLNDHLYHGLSCHFQRSATPRLGRAMADRP